MIPIPKAAELQVYLCHDLLHTSFVPSSKPSHCALPTIPLEAKSGPNTWPHDRRCSQPNRALLRPRPIPPQTVPTLHITYSLFKHFHETR